MGGHRGSEYPTVSAFLHIEAESPFAKNCRVELTVDGWVPVAPWRPTTLRELEEKFLPKQEPNIHRIIQRCPQMAMIHALRGDVSEPYWWAALAITENATPNLSRECSDGYSKFSEAELAERVTRIRNEKKRPALCDRIDSVNRNVCTVCRFRGSVKSPIALGFEHEPKRKAVTP